MENQPDADSPQAPVSENAAPDSSGEFHLEAEDGSGEPIPVEAESSPDIPSSVEADRPGEQAATPAEGDDAFGVLIGQAARGRLKPDEEARATELLREALLGGKPGVARAVEVLPELPWMVGVTAVTTYWPEMKATSRTQLLAGLAKTEGENARRTRLSLARGLWKLDVPTALKVATGVAKDLREKETGVMQPKDAHIFASVFIGRGKPWVVQLALADARVAEADALVQCALYACFATPHAPMTQVSILKWAGDAGRLGKLPAGTLEIVTRGLSRWSGKWHGVLQTEVPELPEELKAVLKPAAEEAEPPRSRAPMDAPEPDAEQAEVARTPAGDGEMAAPTPVKPRPVYESKTIPRRTSEAAPEEARPDRGERPERGERGERAERPERPERPERQERSERPERSGGVFNLPDTLRQIDAYVASLRADLQTSQSKLRQREEELRRGGSPPARRERPSRESAPIIAGEPTAEELARLNLQLEARNLELQQQITELKVDSEDRAASMGVSSEEAAPTPDQQLRRLLELKLQEDFADFHALEKDSTDLVVKRVYPTVLRHVFEVLQSEGLRFSAGAAS